MKHSNPTEQLDLIRARDREILLGAEIQQTLLKGFTSLGFASARIYGRSMPSREVGGDFYDAFYTSQDSLDIVLGDVMGKGVPAALVGAAIRTGIYRTLFEQYRDCRKRDHLPRIDEILAALDDQLRANLLSLHQFATMVYLRYTPHLQRIEYSDCGHTPFCLYEAASGRIWTAKGANMPLGFSDQRQEYSSYAIPVDPGDILLLYSDGLSDAADSEGQRFGMNGIEETLAAAAAADAHDPSRDITQRLLRAAVIHCGDSPQDDITTVAVAFAHDPHPEIIHRLLSRSQLRSLRERLLGDVARILDKRGVADQAPLLDAIGLAILETLSNILDHADLGENCHIDVTIKIDAASLWFQLEYPAEGYEWVEVADRDPGELAAGYSQRGYGQPLIAALVDQYSVLTASEPRTRIVLRKDIPHAHG